MHRSIKLLLVLIVAFAAVELLLPQRFASGLVEWAGIAAGVIPIWLAFGIDAVGESVEAHERAVRYVGIVAVGTGLCGLIGRITWCVSTGVEKCITEEPVTAAIMAIIVFGVALMVLSGQVPAFLRAQRAKSSDNEKEDRNP